MSSEKQVLANQQNALKSTGPKTDEGKAIAARNSLKHGLLAKEVVITEGEGAEDQVAFNALMADLVKQFEPASVLEGMLVEKIAVSYWRLRRAMRYEAGLIRKELDSAMDDFYNEKNNSRERSHLTDRELDIKLQENQKVLDFWKDNIKRIKESRKSGKDLESIYNIDYEWHNSITTYFCLLEYISEKDPKVIRTILNERGTTDDEIWNAHINFCSIKIDRYNYDIELLKKDKINNKRKLQVKKYCGVLPDEKEMNKLLRYETAIEKQLYMAINKLEHLQRLRAGDKVPVPAQIDLNITNG
jgi:hypothetical protein